MSRKNKFISSLDWTFIFSESSRRRERVDVVVVVLWWSDRKRRRRRFSIGGFDEEPFFTISCYRRLYRTLDQDIITRSRRTEITRSITGYFIFFFSPLTAVVLIWNDLRDVDEKFSKKKTIERRRRKCRHTHRLSRSNVECRWWSSSGWLISVI